MNHETTKTPASASAMSESRLAKAAAAADRREARTARRQPRAK